jgi:hypothetical protein
MVRSLMIKVLMKAMKIQMNQKVMSQKIKKSENEDEEQTKETSTAAFAKEKQLGQPSQAKLFAAAQ